MASIASCLAEVPHPGEFIRDEMEARGWLQRDLAYVLGVPEQSVNLILSGKRGISPEMAKAFGKAFDVSAEYFANLQKAYEMSQAEDPSPAIERRARLQEQFPIREMIRRGWLENTDIELLEAQVMRFFGKNNLNDVPCLAFNAKKSEYSETTPLQWAWLYRVRQIASELVVPAYSEKKLSALIDGFQRFMLDPEEVRHVPRALAECGVRFVVVETLPKAEIDGVCFWLDDCSPVIGVTTRHDRIDNFWFVLRHEIEHLKNKDGRRRDISANLVDVDIEKQHPEGLPAEEKRANEAAASFCVPADQLESFYLRKYPYISEKDTLGFAKRVQRHPGIVVGQLQRKMDRWDWLARYKVKVRQHLIGSAIVDGWGVPAPVSL